MDNDTPPVYSISAAHGHSQCLMCGEFNPCSLHLSFILADDGSVSARFNAHSRLQGYTGILHGGVIASLLDAAMTHCLFHHGIEAVTADLHVRYAQAIACDACLDIWAASIESRPPLFRLRGEIAQDGHLMAWSEAKFLLRQGAQPLPGNGAGITLKVL